MPPPPPNPRLSPWKDISKIKGHARSVSHGGVTFSRTGSNRERQRSEDQSTLIGTGGGANNQQQGDAQFKVPLAPALKRPGHRRVFSEATAQICPDQTAIPGTNLFSIFSCILQCSVHKLIQFIEFLKFSGHMKGHVKSASKTDFILPHDHVDREKERRSSVTGRVHNDFSEFSGNERLSPVHHISTGPSIHYWLQMIIYLSIQDLETTLGLK